MKSSEKLYADIESQLDKEFEISLFRAAQGNLADKDNPLRLNNYAFAMRELATIILHRLAPNERVLKCVWYKNEMEKENGITRKQRAIYAIQGGLDTRYMSQKLGIDVPTMYKDLIKSMTKLNEYTHVRPKVFGMNEQDVVVNSKKVDQTLRDFLMSIKAYRKQVADRLWECADQAIVQSLVEESISGLDELASHAYLNEHYTDDIVVTGIDHESVWFLAEGVLDCEIQYGSSSDFLKGDGIVVPNKFPFQCWLVSSVEAPLDIRLVDGSRVGVDTRSWYM